MEIHLHLMVGGFLVVLPHFHAVNIVETSVCGYRMMIEMNFVACNLSSTLSELAGTAWLPTRYSDHFNRYLNISALIHLFWRIYVASSDSNTTGSVSGFSYLTLRYVAVMKE